MDGLRATGHSRRWLVSVTVLGTAMALGIGFNPAVAAGGANIVRVSVSSTGTPGNRDSFDASISADGRFVAFNSAASNLVANDTNRKWDVFVYDRVTNKTRRVSVNSAGTQANKDSFSPSISADGQFVAFQSAASNLVANDTNRKWDVFVYDRATHKTRRMSVNSNGRQGNKGSFTSSISAHGRFVAFASRASNLVGADTNGKTDVFIYSRVTHKTRRVSMTSTGTQGNRKSYLPSISAHGRFVAYQSLAHNLVDADTNRGSDVFMYDRVTQETRRVSVTSTGTQGDGGSFGASISEHGRFVAFYSQASNLVANDTNGKSDVFVYDRSTHKTRRVSVNSTGTQGDGDSSGPSISPDGQFVAFWSNAANLVTGDTNDQADVFVYDRSTHTTRRVSVNATGRQGNSASFDPSISAHGRFVAFWSYATNLVSGGANYTQDVFLSGPLR